MWPPEGPVLHVFNESNGENENKRKKNREIKEESKQGRTQRKYRNKKQRRGSSAFHGGGGGRGVWPTRVPHANPPHRRSCSSFSPSRCRLSQAPPRFPSPAPLKRDSLQHPSRAAKVLGGSPTRYKSGPPPRPPWRPLTLKRNEKWASASCFQCTTHIASANTVLSYVSFTSGVFTEVRAKTGRESTAKHREERSRLRCWLAGTAA